MRCNVVLRPNILLLNRMKKRCNSQLIESRDVTMFDIGRTTNLRRKTENKRRRKRHALVCAHLKKVSLIQGVFIKVKINLINRKWQSVKQSNNNSPCCKARLRRRRACDWHIISLDLFPSAATNQKGLSKGPR